MTCPECKSDDVALSPEGIFCNKCGLEIDDKIVLGEFVSKAEKSQLTTLPKLELIISSKMEMYALKLGLKNGRLVQDWEQLLSINIPGGALKPEMKQQVEGQIKLALKANAKTLIEAHDRFEANWMSVSSKYFVEVEKLMNFSWDGYYNCYISLASKGGIHNSTKNFIIVNYRWKEHSSYIIAHELFHIIFRKYMTRFFKEKYDEMDEKVSEVLVNFILLDRLKLFQIPFTNDMYPPDIKELAIKLYPLWTKQKPFKDFLLDLYNTLGITKTWVST